MCLRGFNPVMVTPILVLTAISIAWPHSMIEEELVMPVSSDNTFVSYIYNIAYIVKKILKGVICLQMLETTADV